MYDYSRIMGRIKEKFGTQASFAKALGMGQSTLNLKLNNKAEWSQDEMTAALGLLDLGMEFIKDYFFCRDSLEN